MYYVMGLLHDTTCTIVPFGIENIEKRETMIIIGIGRRGQTTIFCYIHNAFQVAQLMVDMLEAINGK